MSRSTPPWIRFAPGFVGVLLAACTSDPLLVRPMCGPDDPPGADCTRPSIPSTQTALLILALDQQGLPEPRSVSYHFVTVDLNSRDTAGNSYIQADAVRSESRYDPGRYSIEYVGLEPPGGVACTIDRPRRDFSMLGNDTTRLSFAFQCSAP